MCMRVHACLCVCMHVCVCVRVQAVLTLAARALGILVENKIGNAYFRSNLQALSFTL
jgi:hypothetical protein